MSLNIPTSGAPNPLNSIGDDILSTDNGLIGSIAAAINHTLYVVNNNPSLTLAQILAAWGTNAGATINRLGSWIAVLEQQSPATVTANPAWTVALGNVIVNADGTASLKS